MKINFIKTILSLLLLTVTSISSAFVTVGATADCDYNTLLDAYNDADPFVRITANKTVKPNFTFAKTKWMTGGYASCASASAGDPPVGKTYWLAPFDNMVTFDIDGPVGSNTIIVADGFNIYGGVNTGLGQTGGIKVWGDVFLTIANSNVYDHESEFGGGIQVHGEDARVIATNTQIYNNTAIKVGGGVSCTNGASFTLMGESSIKGNEALSGANLVEFPGHGGGIYADTGCQVTINSGDNNDLFATEFGVLSNIAAGQGGGIYIKGGSSVELTGNANHPASIIGNISNIDTTDVIIGGGGVYLQGSNNFPGDGTSFTSTNGRIELNIAQHAGAGFGVTGGASFTMNRAEGNCWDNDKCSSLSSNFVSDADHDGDGTAAAGYIYDINSTASISQTLLKNNHANESALFYVRHFGNLFLEGNVITDNGPNGQPFASDLITLYAVTNAANLDFFYNTIAGNTVDNHFNFYGSNAQNWVRIYNSIIYDQGDIFTISGNTTPFLRMKCNYVHETNSFPSNGGSIELEDNYPFNPDFVDSANGDYHLQSQSFAKDLCSENEIQSSYPDIEGNPRGIDDPAVPNLRGPFDVGAYEEISFDIIFKDSFE